MTDIRDDQLVSLIEILTNAAERGAFSADEYIDLVPVHDRLVKIAVQRKLYEADEDEKSPKKKPEAQKRTKKVKAKKPKSPAKKKAAPKKAKKPMFKFKPDSSDDDDDSDYLLEKEEEEEELHSSDDEHSS